MGGYGLPGLGSGGKAAIPTACGWERDQSPALADKLPAKAIARNDASIFCFIRSIRLSRLEVSHTVLSVR
jgi:hypothetical protein